MKANIHPNYQDVLVKCACGNNFNMQSSMEDSSLLVEVCNQCHPFYTGKQKIVDTAGRVDRFNNRFNNFMQKKAAETTAAAATIATTKTKATKPKKDTVKKDSKGK